MWEFDCEESWVPKNWSFWTVVLEKTLESPLDCKEIQPVHAKRYQSRVFFGRTDAKDGIPILWPPHANSWLIGKESDAGRDWGQEEKGTTEDEIAGWHHWLNGCESQGTQGVGDGQGGLACCDSWGRKESDTTEWLIWSDPICVLTFLPPKFVTENLENLYIFSPEKLRDSVVPFRFFWVWFFDFLSQVSKSGKDPEGETSGVFEAGFLSLVDLYFTLFPV